MKYLLFILFIFSPSIFFAEEYIQMYPDNISVQKNKPITILISYQTNSYLLGQLWKEGELEENIVLPPQDNTYLAEVSFNEIGNKNIILLVFHNGELIDSLSSQVEITKNDLLIKIGSILLPIIIFTLTNLLLYLRTLLLSHYSECKQLLSCIDNYNKAILNNNDVIYVDLNIENKKLITIYDGIRVSINKLNSNQFSQKQMNIVLKASKRKVSRIKHLLI